MSGFVLGPDVIVEVEDPLPTPVDVEDPIPVEAIGAPEIDIEVTAPDLGSIEMEAIATDVLVLPVVGPRGPPGPASGEYVHTQSVASATWTVVHNLGTRPDLVLFLDEDPDERVFTDVTYPDIYTAVIEWPVPVTGTAYAR